MLDSFYPSPAVIHDQLALHAVLDELRHISVVGAVHPVIPQEGDDHRIFKRPLSDDVFRVNEWRLYKRTDEGEVLRYRDIIIVIKDNSGRFYLKINDGRIYLKYVSDLQHLMFAFKMLN